MVRKKINTARPGEAGYQSCIKLRPMVQHAKKVFWHHHTLHQQLSLQNSLAGTKNNTQLLQYLHTNKPSLLRASDCRCWWFGKELLHGILWVPWIKMYWRQGCYTEISFYWQEMGNTSARAITFLCEIVPNAKYLQKLGTLLLFFCLGPVCLRSGFKHWSLMAYCATQNVIQHRFNIPVSLIKRQRSLIEAVLISFGLVNSFPKM